VSAEVVDDKITQLSLL